MILQRALDRRPGDENEKFIQNAVAVIILAHPIFTLPLIPIFGIVVRCDEPVYFCKMSHSTTSTRREAGWIRGSGLSGSASG